MKGKAVSVIMLTLLSISMLTLAFNIQPVKAGGTIYIRADGSVYPDTAPISSVDKVTYTFTDNIYDSIIVRRNNIVVDGAGYTLQGTGSSDGITLSGRSNVTIKHMEINLFYRGIHLSYSSNNSISGNNIANNQWGVYLWWSSYNRFYHNNFIDNTQQVYIYGSGYANFWDDGYPSGGNYWSDHITVDDYSGVYQAKPRSDGIVDEPYIIDLYNRDNYPLVGPFPSPLGPIRELIETIKSWNLPKGTETCLTKKLYDAISLLEMGNLNGAIHKLGDFVKQVENDRKDLTEEQRSELIFRAQRIIDLIKG